MRHWEQLPNLNKKEVIFILLYKRHWPLNLKIDQSVAHNGVCLTVIAINDDSYTVTAIEETLLKTNLGNLAPGDLVNLERAMKLGDRLDGHIVQGHVDQIGECIAIRKHEGSWGFTFQYNPALANVTIEKFHNCKWCKSHCCSSWKRIALVLQYFLTPMNIQIFRI